ncbi:hypothetical protein D3C77_477210 [compost metagenome]
MTFQHGGGLPVFLHEVREILDIAVAVRFDDRAVKIELHVKLDAHRLGCGLRFLGRHRLDGFNHRDRLLLGAVCPAIGRRDTTADHGAPTGIGGAFDRTKRGTRDAANRGTGRPILLLHARATGQERGHYNHGYCCP